LRHGILTLSLEVRNLLNDRRRLAYDDDVEIPLGYVAPATAGIGRAPQHEEPPTDPTLRGANPAFGLPTAVQSPRAVEVGVSWSF
jgi:hypothetical protein